MATSLSAYTSTPRTEFRGITEEDLVAVPVTVQSRAIRLPLFFTLAQWGDTERANLVSGSTAATFYGDELLNPMGAYYTHQSEFIREQFRGGGKAMLVRLVGAGAKQASKRMAIDWVADDIPQYETNADGSWRLDVDGKKIPTGTTVPGYRIQHRQIEIPTIGGEFNFGAGVESEGSMTSAASGDTSTFTPYFDALARFKGNRGNNEGFRLSFPSIRSRNPGDPDLQERLQACVYRISCIQRTETGATPTIQRSLVGSQSRDLTFKDNTIDRTTSVVYDVNRTLREAYESDNPATFTRYGVFEEVHAYSDLLGQALRKFADAEADFTGNDIENEHEINFLTGVDVNGIPYKTILIEGIEDGGLLMSDNTNFYFEGGSDGQLGDVAYNALVDAAISALDNSDILYHDIAAMPYDSVWDSGFPAELKQKFANFHNLRPDVHVHVCTQDILQPTNTADEDSSAAVMLRSHFRAMQESEEFGMRALRFTVVGNAGIRIGEIYQKQVPYLIHLCYLGALYMGADDGAMRAANSFGRGAENVLPAFKKHNAKTKPLPAQQLDWENGMNFAVYHDIDRSTWAGLRSIHENMASVCSTYINVCILCNVTRIGHIVWRNWSGDSKLDDDQFLEQVEEDVRALTKDKYDDRTVIVPRAYRTALDTALKFSWHLDVEVSMDAGRTVQHLAIIARDRRADAEAA